MQIRDDLEPLPESGSKRRLGTALIQRLLNRNQAEDETIRMPLSALAFWHDPMNPDLETLQVRLRLNLSENSDDEETLVDPLAI